MSDVFTAADDGLHEPGDSFYENETFWFSFFVPERRIGAWLYAGVRQNAGVTHGGLWIWDDNGSLAPWDAPFYEHFSHLKLPAARGPEEVRFPTGFTVRVRQPLASYDLSYDDRDRVRVELRFDAVEPAVPLRTGAPPYPRAAHFDQIGRVTGTVHLDGETVVVDCFAMRDRSWGARTERGYRRVGYSWAGSQALSLLTYSSPAGDADDVHTGYLRRDGKLHPITSGRRWLERDRHGHLRSIDLDVVDEAGRQVRAHGEPLSDLLLPNSTSLCVCTALTWTVDGETLYGEDQDVWPTAQWRARGGRG